MGNMKLTIDLHKGEEFYIARIPELGVTTQGKTIEEAKRNLEEAVKLHLESLVSYMIEKGNVKFEDGHVIPQKN